MTKDSFNMQSFHHRIYINKPADEVYRLFGTASGLEKWFMGETVYESPEGEKRKYDDYVHRGDEFRWQWLEKDLEITGRVLEAEISSCFKFTFGPSFIVTISVKEDSGRTLFTLAQQYSESSPADDFAHINCCVCWAFFITNLKSVAEFGNDLRETISRNEELVNR